MNTQMIEPPIASMPRAPRTMTTLLIARMERAGCPDTLCRIRNVSMTGLLAETPVPLSDGVSVSIRLRGGAVVNGNVAWYHDGRAGIAVDGPFDLDQFLSDGVNEMGAPRAPRFDVECAVRLGSYATAVAGTVENLSQTGARLTTARPLQRGSMYPIAIPGLPPRYCVVRWTDGEEVGVRFSEPLAYDTLAVWLRDRSAAN